MCKSGGVAKSGVSFRMQLPVPAQVMSQPPCGHDRMQLPVFLHTTSQPPPSQVRMQLPVPRHSKLQLPLGQLRSQLPIMSHTQVSPEWQIPDSFPMLKQADANMRPARRPNLERFIDSP